MSEPLFNKHCVKSVQIRTKKTPYLDTFHAAKVAGVKAFNFIKKRLQHRCFPMNIAKFSGTDFFIEHLRLLLL